MDTENNKKQIAEIIIDDMIILDNKGSNGEHAVEGADLAVGEAPTESMDVVGSETAGNIEDIVIPDDIDTTEAVETPKATEETKNDEMPF